MGRVVCVLLFILGLSLGTEAQDTTQCSSVSGVAKYKLSDNYGTCLLMNVSISVTIQNSSQTLLTLSSDPGVDCSNDSSCTDLAVQIAFNLTTPQCVSCKLVLSFSQNNSKQWGLSAMNFSGTVNTTYLEVSNSSLRFSNAANQTFRCNSPQTVSMTSNSSNITVLVTTSNLRVQAFSFKGTDRFDAERVCVADLQGLLIVPVAVGSALAALVFVLLIGYLASRFVVHRRKHYSKVS